jgi:hypothetical protein
MCEITPRFQVLKRGRLKDFGAHKNTIWLDCSPAPHKTLIGTSARKWWTVETQEEKNHFVLI